MPLLLSCFIMLLLSNNRYILAILSAYIVYMLIDPAPDSGGRKSMFLRRLSMWKYMADFFPMKLVKTVDLDPSLNYVFGYISIM